MEPSDGLVKHYEKIWDEELGADVMTPIRYMTADEERERTELRYANTAPALRARVVAELANRNGH